MTKLWGGRFSKETDSLVEEFNASIPFDYKLAMEDLAGSIAHCNMLVSCGVLKEEEGRIIIAGLKEIETEISAGDFQFEIGLEDIHMNIEKRLTEKVGPVGGKLHTARSRNDQVALDMHIYVKLQIKETTKLIANLQKELISQSEKNMDTVIPGYTHLQRAQPVLFSHHLMSYFWMLQRDKERFSDAFKRADMMPLGAGALAGTSFPINREQVAQELGFSSLYENSMDAVSDRDFILEYLSNASILMMHLSRFSEEIIIWSSQEFDFIELDDAHTTGSSIMPQKKNPDIAELVRGKTGRVYGSLLGLLTVMKGLPLAYNKDLQEDKEGIFDTVDTVQKSLRLYRMMLGGMRVNSEKTSQAVKKDFANATDLADYLVRKNIPFREAHEVVGKMVSYCLNKGVFLQDLKLGEVQDFHPSFKEDIKEILDPLQVVKARNSRGGTAPVAVKEQIKKAISLL